MAPSQNVFLSSAAQRTKRLHFGPGVYVLPLHHPLRLIEEVSMLDHLSGGRLELGVGRGGVLEAFFWGQESDEKTNAARYEEVLACLQNGLQNEELNFDGLFYHFDRVPMRLRPLQQPMPSFWYMRNPETAAQHGMNCIVVGSLDTLEANVVRYKNKWKEFNPSPLTAQGREPLIGLVVHIMLAEDEQTAIEEAKPAAAAYQYNLSAPRRLEAERRGLTQFMRPPAAPANAEAGAQQQDKPAERRGPARHMAVEERKDLEASLAKLEAEERAIRDQRRRSPGGIPGFVAGSPESVRDYFDEYMKTGANYMVLSFQWGSVSHEQAMRSIRLFREHLMPHYNVADPFNFADASALVRT
jgi:alkanesulfonate monooxygenase SsuD/methylene tetrahydromethanopterin reductase-like flavin-dependent oxidoreductase (luciferase family)